MDSHQELEALVRRYLAHNATLLAVRDWLYAHADDIFHSDDAAFRELADVVWSRISDFEARDLDENGVRQAISAEFPTLLPVRSAQDWTRIMFSQTLTFGEPASPNSKSRMRITLQDREGDPPPDPYTWSLHAPHATPSLARLSFAVVPASGSNADVLVGTGMRW